MLGIVLPGGGARSAYQVGVLKALAGLLPRDAPVPFRVISGTSAGAIIGATVAAHGARFREGALSLERFWRNFHVQHVFRADTPAMLGAGLHWLAALLTGGTLVRPPRAIFDNRPLRSTLERHVDFARVRASLAAGHLDALVVHATDYRNGGCVAFHECAPAVARAWRLGRAGTLSHEHLMASAAVPFVFPAVRIGEDWYGDGAMRQLAPLSATIRLGADRLLVVGLRAPDALPAPPTLDGGGPSFGQIFGFMLDTLFMDGVQSDLERLRRDNALIEAAGPAAGALRSIDARLLAPSADFGPIAERHARTVPRTLRVLLRTMGAAGRGGRTLLSYLLFESGYTRELVALGYADAMARRDELREFLAPAVESADRRRRA